jgi:hypothetical protein
MYLSWLGAKSHRKIELSFDFLTCSCLFSGDWQLWFWQKNAELDGWMQSINWYFRVASKSNISDDPSGRYFTELDTHATSRVVTWRSCSCRKGWQAWRKNSFDAKRSTDRWLLDSCWKKEFIRPVILDVAEFSNGSCFMFYLDVGCFHMLVVFETVFLCVDARTR